MLNILLANEGFASKPVIPAFLMTKKSLQTTCEKYYGGKFFVAPHIEVIFKHCKGSCATQKHPAVFSLTENN